MAGDRFTTARRKFDDPPVQTADLLTLPDALRDAKISAKVALAHFRLHPYQNRTLFELLKDPSKD
ncbi:hypothetical protein [Bradyrhizobium sp. CCBAU 11361]|uniref:hypothetical protein n=1 Tax=Bradyrhizobium sp. CCBAU 11361 TaxID=1630812 RepID=UPI002304A061|nr:hypothetical protein [Bradyrhizobium sp. CCBAU 11361]MDA9490301.1 hypothetical protein [Bradyrhizobium sp. CCBAU 11361]MDA9491102.1 hypothetical protein [Bradyrhizobium sp. CCBAU 11361]